MLVVRAVVIPLSLVAVLGATCPAWSQPHPPPGREQWKKAVPRTVELPLAERGWEILFDGGNLSAWGLGAQGGIWTVNSQGELYAARPGPDLFTKRRYCDFVLELEFKMAPNRRSNSGVFLRVHDPAQAVNTGLEMQILDNHDYGVSFSMAKANGALYNLAGPAFDASVPVGQWNHARIMASGSQVAVELNGRSIVQANLDRWTTSRRNPDGSENGFPHPIAALPQEGFVGLQNFSAAPVWFRNIRIGPAQ